MANTLGIESTLTDRYQTTVPSSVRKALKLAKRDKILYQIEPDGRVVLTKATDEHSDPVLGQFLQFLAEDIATHPSRLQAVDAGLAQRIKSLVGDVELDLEAPLPEHDE